MPRKPKRQSRSLEDAPIQRPAVPRLPATPSRRLIYQCLQCGALVDPIFGTGEESYCPHCHTGGDVCCREGMIPDPQRYGTWLRKQEEAEKMKQSSEVNASRIPSSPNPFRKGGITMKQRKLHSGTYHCPECLIEYDLTMEESLKCDQCGSALVKGGVEDYEDGADDEDADPE